MNQKEFLKKWIKEKELYEAWGGYVVDEIKRGIAEKGFDINSFLKIPVQMRLKEDGSLLDKAFFRPEKSYEDPYEEIEDKVGARFVVLLLEQIDEIIEIIRANSIWTFDECRHFNLDRESQPLLFSYQSVHYILRPSEPFDCRGIEVHKGVSCELQVRTLLQHAHAELTHQSIYKNTKRVKPAVQRTVAKSMALIETTDSFFEEATKELNKGPLEDLRVIERLDSLYRSLTKLEPNTQKSALVLWDQFEQFVDEEIISKVQEMMKRNPFIIEIIKERYKDDAFYQQSTVLFAFWLLKKKTKRTLLDWPLSRSILELIALDLGVSIED